MEVGDRLDDLALSRKADFPPPDRYPRAVLTAIDYITEREHREAHRPPPNNGVLDGYCLAF